VIIVVLVVVPCVDTCEVVDRSRVGGSLWRW